MRIPNFIDCQFTNKDGFLSGTWRQILTQLFTELQKNTSVEGLVFPSQTTSNINTLGSNVSVGSLLYDKDTKQPKVNVEGVFKVIQTAGNDFNETVPGLSYDNSTGTLSLDAGYDIPTTIMEANWNSKEPGITPGTNLQYWRGDKTWQTLNTAVVPELTNLYYTDSRARLALSSSATGLTYTNTTGDFSLTSGYVIPTTTEESNWNSAYAASVTNATALDTPNTIVKRDANGRTAVSLSDDNSTPRLSLDHNNRRLIDWNGRTNADWQNKVLSEYESTHSTLYTSVDWGNFQLWSWWKHYISFHPIQFEYLAWCSIDWKQCSLYGSDTWESINWDGHTLNYYGSATLSVDYGGGGLWDPNSYISLDWVSRQLLDSTGGISGDYNTRAFYDADSRVSVDYEGRYLQDKFSNYAVDWGNYVLTKSSGIITVDWENYFLLDMSGNPVLAWNDYALANSDGFTIITWGNGSFKLNSSDSGPSIDYDIKQLQNGFGPVVDWSAGFKLFSASTGSGTALLGANSPSAHLTAPYTWVDIIAPDGTACVMPIWKK